MGDAIGLREGERKTGVEIVVRPLKETTVSGIVVTDGDQPVADADVMVAPADHEVMVMSSTRTDVTGTFRLRVLTGVTYVLRATARASSGVRHMEVTLFVDQAQDGLRLSWPQ